MALCMSAGNHFQILIPLTSPEAHYRCDIQSKYWLFEISESKCIQGKVEVASSGWLLKTRWLLLWAAIQKPANDVHSKIRYILQAIQFRTDSWARLTRSPWIPETEWNHLYHVAPSRYEKYKAVSLANWCFKRASRSAPLHGVHEWFAIWMWWWVIQDGKDQVISSYVLPQREKKNIFFKRKEIAKQTLRTNK